MRSLQSVFIKALLLASVCVGATANAAVTSNTWFMYNHDQTLVKDLSVHFDGIARQTASVFEHRQNILRGSLLYEAFDGFKAGVGYAHQNTENWNASLETPMNEDRIYEELSYHHVLSDLGVDHRVRFEQRFRESRINGSESYQNRLRYQAKLKIPLRASEHYVSIADEIFFQSHDGAPTVYGQNRFSVSLGLPLAKFAKSRLEAGWLWQDNPRTSSTPAFTVHLLQLSFYTAGSFL